MKHGAERTAGILRRGNGWTRLSALVMGAGCLRHGQIVKGLLYLGFEVLYVLFFFGFGWPYLRLFPTLGTTAQSEFGVSQHVLGTFWTPAEAFGAELEAHSEADLQTLLDQFVSQVTAQ